MYEWVLNTPLKGFVQDAPREELATAPIVEYKQITSKQTLRLKLKFSMTFSRLEEYEHALLRKELLIAHRAL